MKEKGEEESMPRSRSRSKSKSKSKSRSRSRSRSASSSPARRSRSPASDHENRDNDRSNEYRIHVAELPQGVQENEIRRLFQRYGDILDVWAASASCFAFVVYKTKEEAQKAIDQMDGRYDIEIKNIKINYTLDNYYWIKIIWK